MPMVELDLSRVKRWIQFPLPLQSLCRQNKCMVKQTMISIWQKFKVGLLIGMLYAVYYLIRSSQALKRLEIHRPHWSEKS